MDFVKDQLIHVNKAEDLKGSTMSPSLKRFRDMEPPKSTFEFRENFVPMDPPN